jgi:hypothetical protein
MPEGVSKARLSRFPRSSAFWRNMGSPLASKAASKPPSSRIVVSKTLTRPARSKERELATQLRASSNSCFMPMSQSVSSESTSVHPMPPQGSFPRADTGFSSSLPQACRL